MICSLNQIRCNEESSAQKVVLNDGNEMPIIGLGTWMVSTRFNISKLNIFKNQLK